MTSALTLPTSDDPLESSGFPPAPGVEPLPFALDHMLDVRLPGLVATRRFLHAHPELSGQEFGTAGLIVRELTSVGLAPRLLPKGNGVICDIDGRPTGPIIALRADTDALPVTDTKDVPYRSTVDGVCHACGHDVHTTVLLGVGQVLARLAERGELAGRVRLIFQPSEEKVPSGAPEVIAAGGLDEVAAIYALHCAPQLEAGLIGVRPGPFTSAADMIEVRLTGPGGHTARPHLTVDLVHALARVVIDVPALLGRRVDARAGTSLVWGAVRAGEAHNTVPTEGFVRGTLRTLDPKVWREAPDLVPALIRDAIAGTGAEAEVRYVRGFPAVVNDRAATDVVAAAARRALGPDQVVEAELSMGSEDFAFYLDHVPGAMIRLGTGRAGAGVQPDIHQSGFDVDERAIGYGVLVMAYTALAALSGVAP